MRFIGRRDDPRVPERPAREDGAGPRRRPATTTASRSSWPSTTGDEPRSSTPRGRFTGGDEDDFAAALPPEMGDPDLLMRTSGEQRISNYLLWQCAYSELVFRDELWPDFTRDDLEACLEEYAARQRRFGGRQLSVSTGRAAAAAARRNSGSDLGARGCSSRSRRSPSPSRSSPPAAGSSRPGCSCSASLCMHELFHDARAHAAGQARRLPRARPALIVAAHLERRAVRAARARDLGAGRLPARRR